ncbi:MAG: DUF2461 domain-containing protein [Bacteroidetes bacterium]|nr:DUF2461 domain-containing protein [Bacteroidota bacterium]MBI3482128.1 DUF2461 domain-containing protein [Bacteroidota bacterium]
MKIVIEKSTFDFLKGLKRNNNREWFEKNKKIYLEAQANVSTWVNQLIHEMNRHDQLQTVNGKESLYRIYNDVRFSEDKTPYNPRFAGYLKREKPMLRGGYYYWIKPGASRVACGFAHPKPEDLKRIREDIELNRQEWRKLLSGKKLRATFGEMQGDQVKTSPRGFAIDNPAIELLRYKQYWFEHSFTDNEVLSPDFLHRVNETFKTIRPFFNYMSDVLTTNRNGELL